MGDGRDGRPIHRFWTILKTLARPARLRASTFALPPSRYGGQVALRRTSRATADKSRYGALGPEPSRGLPTVAHALVGTRELSFLSER